MSYLLPGENVTPLIERRVEEEEAQQGRKTSQKTISLGYGLMAYAEEGRVRAVLAGSLAYMPAEQFRILSLNQRVR
jgi:hypothetical protein